MNGVPGSFRRMGVRQRILSRWLGHSCRFRSGCSARLSGLFPVTLETHGPRRGLWLTLQGPARCTPPGPGLDPLPPAPS